MTLSDRSVFGKPDIIERLKSPDKQKRIYVSPILSSSQIQPASMDLRLGPEFLVINIGKITHMDPLRNPDEVSFEVEKYTNKYKILRKYEKFILHPGEFVLGCTLEYIRLPMDIAARLEGRSSWGRLGVLVHSTAGYIDPGFSGNITFELKNVGKVPVALYPGVRMAQLSFFRVHNDRKYKGKYNESFGVVSSKYFKDYEFEKMRTSYNCYDEIITDILESVENKTGIPRTNSQSRFPQELIDAIYRAYEDQTSGYDND